jgi:PKD repeat protein
VVSETVTFIDTSVNGVKSVQAGIDIPPITQWLWDFGDGSPMVTTQDAKHAYLMTGTFTVTLTVTDAVGYTDSTSNTLAVSAPELVADFTYSPMPASIKVDDAVTFTDASTTDGPAIVTYTWSFGDGGTSSLQNPVYTYTQVGTYTVSLVVTDALGYSDDEVKSDIVVVSDRCIPLTSASFVYAPASPALQSTTVFTASYLPLEATMPITYEWDFGDGQTGTGATVQHIYTVPGTMTVELLVKNDCTVDGVSSQQEVGIAGPRVYLPVVLRNY